MSYLGMLVFGIGHYFESVGDGQLQALKAESHNKGRAFQDSFMGSRPEWQKVMSEANGFSHGRRVSSDQFATRMDSAKG